MVLPHLLVVATKDSFYMRRITKLIRPTRAKVTMANASGAIRCAIDVLQKSIYHIKTL